MHIPKKGFRRWIVLPLHIATGIMLISIATLFAFLIFQYFAETALLIFHREIDASESLERAFFIFLLIEVVASVKIYFSENYHFPLRFFIYIGITDLIRQIIIQRDNAEHVLMHALALIILVAALAMLELKNNYLLKNKIDDNDHFEL